MKQPLQKALGLVAAAWPALFGLAAVACLMLTAMRIFYNLSLRQPFQIFTSGLEEEALFSVWKYVHGQAVFSDPFSIPFSGSYFNWLFYAAYGSITGLILHGFRLSSDWIPTITHLISLGFAIICVPLTVLLIRALAIFPNNNKQTRWLGWAAGILMAFSPLVGWWNLTTRPDIGALFLELLAFFLAVRFVRTNRLSYLGGTILVAFLAWSFREIAVNVISGLCIYLLLGFRWKRLATVVGLTFTLYALTFVVGGTAFWANTVTCNATSGLFVSHGLENLFLTARKAPLLLAGLAAFVVFCRRAGWREMNPGVQLLAVTWCFSILWNFFTSMKIGASDNYFMPAVAFSVLLGMAMLGSTVEPAPVRPLKPALFAIILLGQIACCLMVLGGVAGRIDLRADQVLALALKQKLADAEGPILVTSRGLNLPWINPATPHFVYAYVYRVGPFKTHSYQAGGLEGLIDQRYFEMIISPKSYPDPEWISLIGRYRLQAEDDLFKCYVPEAKSPGQ